MARPRDTERKPWGIVITLLTGCLVTLVGVLNSLEPHVILFRAAAAASALGLLTSVATGFWQQLLSWDLAHRRRGGGSSN